MKKLMKNLLIISSFYLATAVKVFAGGPSIEMNLYPRSTPGDVQRIIDFAKEKNGTQNIESE